MLEVGTINYGVPPGSILGPLLFLLYINDIPQVLSDSHTHPYADDTTISYQHMDIAEIKNVLNKEFANMCEWFIDNKLSIHFDEDKTKCILFSKEKNLPGLKITYKNNRIKPFNIVEYLGCYLDANLSRESMAIKSLKKITGKLRFSCRQSGLLNPKLHKLLCNSLIQLHFDFRTTL